LSKWPTAAFLTYGSKGSGKISPGDAVSVGYDNVIRAISHWV